MAYHAKQPACANCYYQFLTDEPDEFCPRCGQQNHEVNIGFGHVVEEFLEGVFHFDGKVFRTAGLLLFKPGQLTKRFLAGHRMPYVPPIRLYVFISFVFFALLSLLRAPHETEKHGADDFSSEKRKEYFSQSAGKGHDLATWHQDSLMHVYRQMMQEQLDDTAGAYNATNGANIMVYGMRFSLYEYKKLTTNLTNTQLDSIIRSKGHEPGFFSRKAVRALIRWKGVSTEEVFHQLLRGTSILLFFLMPLAALLLKGAYFRQHRHYVSHLIFTVHVHCFLFVYLAIMLLLEKLNLPEAIDALLFPLPVVYFIVALHTFYQQRWGATLLKSLLLSVAYGIMLFAAGLVVGVGGLLYF